MPKLMSGTQHILLAVIMTASFLFMLGSARQDSATYDEPVHMLAGYSCLALRDCRLSPSHPPLARALMALPLAAMKPVFPEGREKWAESNLFEWQLARDFLYANGNDWRKMLLSSRLVNMTLTLGLVLFTYIWASSLIGGWWGLVPAAFVALSPNFLAHGHYATTDIGAALGLLGGTYFFLRFLFIPSSASAAVAGAALGTALLLKFSTVILLPCFVLIAAAQAFVACGGSIKAATERLWRAGKHFLILAACAGAIIYAVYAALNVNYPVQAQQADTQLILADFHGHAFSPQIESLAGNRLTAPLAQYLFGLRLTIHRIAGGNTSYFCGEVTNRGNIFYFPFLILIKEALPALVLMLGGLIASISALSKAAGRGTSRTEFLYSTSNRFTFFSLSVVSGAYLAYSFGSPLNIGLRHILPVFPLLYILAAGAIKNAFERLPEELPARSLKMIAMPLLILWLFAEAVYAYPCFLSRYNELGGGNYGGYLYSADSNFDWGQDLSRLAKWLDNPPNGERVDRIAVDYYGMADLRAHPGERAVKWSSSDGDPRDRGIKWLAVSASSLTQATGRAGRGCRRTERDEYRWLPRPLHPNYKAGTSIFIYKLAD